MQTKIWTIGVAIALWVLPAQGLAQVLVEPLVASPSVSTGLAEPIIRQQAVAVSPWLLQYHTSRTVTLHLFADAVFEATLTRFLGPVGQDLWQGKTSQPACEVVLATDYQTLAANIICADTSYQLRPDDSTRHWVRQVKILLQPQSSAAGPVARTASDSDTVHTIVNQERSLAGLHPLAKDSKLTTAAQNYSQLMADSNHFNHTGPDGSTPGQRITAAGYSYNAIGENIAAGYTSPEAVMVGWMNSSGHRANILSSTFCDLGVGKAYNAASDYGIYWTQNFGRKSGISTCPTPPPEPPPPPPPPPQKAVSLLPTLQLLLLGD